MLISRESERDISSQPQFQISIYSKLMLKPKPLNSCSNTFSDSGIPGAGIGSPLTIAS